MEIEIPGITLDMKRLYEALVGIIAENGLSEYESLGFGEFKELTGMTEDSYTDEVIRSACGQDRKRKETDGIRLRFDGSITHIHLPSRRTGAYRYSGVLGTGCRGRSLADVHPLILRKAVEWYAEHPVTPENADTVCIDRSLPWARLIADEEHAGEVIARLQQIMFAPFRDAFLVPYGMSIKTFSETFLIPYRTVQEWSRTNDCRIYMRLLFAGVLGEISYPGSSPACLPQHAL